MKNYYLVRLDDACEYMNHKKWSKIEEILNKYNIKPLVGIIPNNEDVKTIIEKKDDNFYIKVKEWEKIGWTIALHGFNHICESNSGGINPVHKRSEFAGVSLDIQRNKISSGYKILKKNGINPSFFFAPSHTFDLNTIESIKSETEIKIISDTFTLFPYKYRGLCFIPCQMGKFRRLLLPGYWTFCFHPNEMTEIDFNEFERFISLNVNKFISFNDIDYNNIKGKKIIDYTVFYLYKIYRILKSIHFK